MNDREQIHLHESQVLVLRDAFQKKGPYGGKLSRPHLLALGYLTIVSTPDSQMHLMGPNMF